MKTALLAACLALTVKPAAALELGESKALDQAGAIQAQGGSSVYDNNASRGSVTAAAGVRALASDGCADETCGFRRGGPPPAELRKEPKSPFTKVEEEKKAANRQGFDWKGLAMIVGGAGMGALAGFLIGGPIGALVGGLLGGLMGWVGPKLLK